MHHRTAALIQNENEQSTTWFIIQSDGTKTELKCERETTGIQGINSKAGDHTTSKSAS